MKCGSEECSVPGWLVAWRFERNIGSLRVELFFHMHTRGAMKLSLPLKWATEICHWNSSISSKHAPSAQVERNYWYCIHNNQWENIGDRLSTKSPIELKDEFSEEGEILRNALFDTISLWSRLGRQENVVRLYLDQVFQWVRESGFANSQQMGFEKCNDMHVTCISFFFLAYALTSLQAVHPFLRKAWKVYEWQITISYKCSELLKDKFMQDFQIIWGIIGCSILIINIGNWYCLPSFTISLLKLAAESM